MKLDAVECRKGVIEFTEGKIALDQMRQTRATVISIADGAWNDEPKPRCAVGDHILFRQLAGEMLDDVEGDDKYRIINDKDVYAVLEPISAA